MMYIMLVSVSHDGHHAWPEKRIWKVGTQGKGLAVVTGASSGIGKIYADRLAKRGFDLLLVARRKQRLEELSQELQQKYGVKAEILVADLGNSADLERVSKALASDERITLLV